MDISMENVCERKLVNNYIPLFILIIFIYLFVCLFPQARKEGRNNKKKNRINFHFRTSVQIS